MHVRRILPLVVVMLLGALGLSAPAPAPGNPPQPQSLNAQCDRLDSAIVRARSAGDLMRLEPKLRALEGRSLSIGRAFRALWRERLQQLGGVDLVAAIRRASKAMYRKVQAANGVADLDELRKTTDAWQRAFKKAQAEIDTAQEFRRSMLGSLVPKAQAVYVKAILSSGGSFTAEFEGLAGRFRVGDPIKVEGTAYTIVRITPPHTVEIRAASGATRKLGKRPPGIESPPNSETPATPNAAKPTIATLRIAAVLPSGGRLAVEFHGLPGRYHTGSVFVLANKSYTITKITPPGTVTLRDTDGRMHTVTRGAR